MISACFATLITGGIILLSPTDPAGAAWEAYLTGDFTRVETIFRAAVEDTSISDRQLARVYLAMGCADAMLKRAPDAATMFETALKLDPRMRLTDSDLPPPVWRIFQPIQERIVRAGVDTLKVPAEPRVSRSAPPPDTDRELVPYRRGRAAVLKSLAFPGLGHLSEGKRRGFIYMGIETLAVGGWIASMVAADRAHDDYLKARTPREISTRYDRYNRLYRLSWGFGLVAAGTYIIAQYDFFSRPPPVGVALTCTTPCTIDLMQVSFKLPFLH